MQGEPPAGNPSSADEVPGCREGKPDVPQAAEAQQGPDQEDHPPPAGSSGQDAEGDAEDGARASRM